MEAVLNLLITNILSWRRRLDSRRDAKFLDRLLLLCDSALQLHCFNHRPKFLCDDTVATNPLSKKRLLFLTPRRQTSTMRSLVPFRDINVHASSSHYAFTSPSSPSAQTLVVERPSGDLRLNDGALLGAKRVSSIAGILGMIKLRLGEYVLLWRQKPC